LDQKYASSQFTSLMLHILSAPGAPVVKSVVGKYDHTSQLLSIDVTWMQQV